MADIIAIHIVLHNMCTITKGGFDSECIEEAKNKFQIEADARSLREWQ